MDNKSLSHTKWKCQYHIVFIPKYRKKILYGRVRNDVREIISTLCKYKDVDIIAGAVCVDHIHLSFKSLFVHVGKHQNLIRAVILHNNRNHAIRIFL